VRNPLSSTASLLVILGLSAACNEPPDGGAVSIAPQEPLTTDDLVATLDTPVSDPNDDELTYTWSWTRNAQPVEVDGETVSSELTARGQVWQVQVVASDGKEQAPTLSAEVVIGNTPPTATVDLPESAETDDDITAVATTVDVDEDTVEVDWSWTVDGSTTTFRSATLPASATSKGEVWEVTATPRDQDDPGEPATASITIANAAPTVASARVEPPVLVEGSTASCVGEGWSDDDGDPEGYEVAWQVDGTEVSTAETLTGVEFDKGQSVTCTLTPDDGFTLGEPVTSDAVVVGNTPPTLSEGSLEPADPTTTSEISLVPPTITDVDGDEVTLSYTWKVDGEPVSTSDTLAPELHAKDQVITVDVIPNDGDDDGPVLTVGSLTIGNTPPEVTSASIEPTTLRTDDTARVVLETRDIDDDPVSFSIVWLVNGSRVASGATLDGTTSFAKDDVLTAEITPNDGDEDGTAFTTAGITVANTAPGAPTIEISPSTPTPGASLTCSIDKGALDADGDSLTYTASWTVDGSAYTRATTTTFTGDTIPAEVTKDTEKWACSVVASDGTDTGPAASASTTVKRWSGPRTFTTCGATGQDGPSSSACTTAYTSTTLAGEVTVSSGKQSWTVPVTGTYRIEAYGAQGKSAETGRTGGRGARMRGDFALKAGDTLIIGVGQVGMMNSCNGGGGGGSFVFRGSTPLVVAGGGGGTRASVDQNGCDASTAQMAGTGSGSATTHGCGLKASSTIGRGGIVSSSSWGSAGGGLGGNGAGEYSADNGGKSWRNGNTGGGNSTYPAYGGFGGGGAGNGSCGGGGGGGYSGGDGGRLAGAGGSYNTGSSQSNSAGARSGDGLVTIDLL